MELSSLARPGGRRAQAVREQVDVKTKLPGAAIDGVFIRRQQVEEQRGETASRELVRHKPIARTEPAASAAVREQHQAARICWDIDERFIHFVLGSKVRGTQVISNAEKALKRELMNVIRPRAFGVPKQAKRSCLLRRSNALDTTGFVKYAGALIAISICSACGGAQGDMAVAPSTASLNGAYTYAGRTLSVNGKLVTIARPPSPLPRYATIVPDHRAKKFEYVINFYGSYATIFNYPKSTQQIGTINNVGGQGCTNVLYGYGSNTFWIVAAYNQITEYHVPQKPLKTLTDSVGMPSSCAMNTSGDLAVGILDGSGAGDVVIFKSGSGSGTAKTTPLAREYFDGYDAHGNLFADGFTSASNFALVELPKGSSKFRTITTSNTVEFPGSVQWDGTYLTVFDQLANATYQYTISGTTATLKGTVQYRGSSDCGQTWIVKGLIYCGDAGNDGGEVFKYPAGGSPIAILTGNFDTPLGVTVAQRVR
jgi:hypothetical protein